MAFRIDDISLHLMPAQNGGEKEKDKEKDRDDKVKKKEKLDDPGGVPCTMVSGSDDQPDVQNPGCPRSTVKQSAGLGGGTLALLQAQLRSTLSPPPH